MRINGFSGFDVDAAVKELMTAARKPADKLHQQKQLQTWKTDAYRDVNTKISELRNLMQDMRWTGDFNKNSSESSNPDAVTATVTGSPTQTSYDITGIKLAESERAASVKFFGNGNLTDPTKPMSDYGATAGSILINGISITVDPAKSLNDLITTVNTTAGIGLTMSYSATEKSITFSSSSTGDSSKITIDPSAPGAVNPLSGLGIKTGSTGKNNDLNDPNTFADSTISSVQGRNKTQAEATINGLLYKSDTNSITYDGVKFDLKSTSASTTTVTQKKDNDAIFDRIKKFVDTYNGLVDDLTNKVNERKAKGYDPLTDEQKSAMKDSQIESWEAKAKEGLLGKDPLITNLLTKMRASVNAPVINMKLDIATNTYTPETVGTLSSIGVGLADSWRDNGKLKIDETKLKAAIANDLTKVTDIFSKSTSNLPSTDTSNTLKSLAKYDQSGVADRLYEQLDASMLSLGTQALNGTTSVVGKQISEIDKRIDDFEKRMGSLEDRYYKQFTAMEKAMQQANSQSSWLMSQFGGGQ
ncbi:flagellar filament capping protein FliD [Peribacillus kribbensis]|uniref:flagellar filament capping protein FliD n=1 Tax=Peribacillus kribbensis TaxID=356658 RepID=UPI00041FCE27|nr:flagellar filament capping protein FliD [Peribacillus kribbensis]